MPVSWGIEDNEGNLSAFIHYSRIDDPSSYSVYGDMADLYERFEEGGFSKHQPVKSYAEGYAWLRENAETEIGGENE